ncbi:glycoside hydrolase family 5 protein [Dentipellis sp. KUC8613]|nr:glycoside hydrolase family 5 protein [Dentipellis sp. KUC8613]
MASVEPSEASFILVSPDSPLSASASASAADTKAAQGTTPSFIPSSSDSPTHPKPHPSAHAGYKAGATPSYAHDWSPAGVGGALRVRGRHFVDAHGRVCGLRGVNLSGSSKTPVNHDHATFPAGHESVTFVGRPFPLDEAHEHLARLRRWGLTFVRFLVTWEAVEHDGPGQYDQSYLAYLRSLLSLLPLYGLTAFVCLHQDVWSRYAGGSGAPAWTLEMVGFDLHALEESGAAWLKGVRGGGHVEAERGLWPCGYQKLAAATMATCFWAGDTFAPKVRVRAADGREMSVQQFLQNAFLDMWEAVARAVGDLEGVLGFELMNEPHRGYIGLPSLHGFDYNTDLHLSHVPSALQSFMLGSGYPTTVGHWTRSFPLPTRLTSHSVLNSASRKAWRADGPTGGRDIWELHGVWGYDTAKNEGIVLRESYFTRDPASASASGREVDWYADCYFPLLLRWTNRVRSAAGEDKVVFAEPIPNEYCPASWTRECCPRDMVFAPHWYDLNALFAKAFGDFTVNVQGLSRGMFPLRAFYWGLKGARDNFALQIRNIVQEARKVLGERPIVIGECGIPMDMNKGEAFRTDDWKWQTRMMDAMITGLERSLVSFTLWNYNPDNDDARGDDWNGENFSWFSRARARPAGELPSLEQDCAALDEGARILCAVVRPYAAKTAGIPLEFTYEMTTGAFAYSWAEPKPEGGTEGDKDKGEGEGEGRVRARETEIFVPAQLTRGRRLVVRGLRAGDTYAHDERRQTLFVLPEAGAPPGAVHRVEVRVEPAEVLFVVNDFWTDFGMWILAVIMVLVGVGYYALGD